MCEEGMRVCDIQQPGDSLCPSPSTGNLLNNSYHDDHPASPLSKLSPIWNLLRGTVFREGLLALFTAGCQPRSPGANSLSPGCYLLLPGLLFTEVPRYVGTGE